MREEERREKGQNGKRRERRERRKREREEVERAELSARPRRTCKIFTSPSDQSRSKNNGRHKK